MVLRVDQIRSDQLCQTPIGSERRRTQLSKGTHFNELGSTMRLHSLLLSKHARTRASQQLPQHRNVRNQGHSASCIMAHVFHSHTALLDDPFKSCYGHPIYSAAHSESLITGRSIVAVKRAYQH